MHKIEWLGNKYKEQPVIFVKMCKETVHAEEAARGLFWANPINEFRESKTEGVADKFEAIPRIQNFGDSGFRLGWTLLPNGKKPTGKEKFTYIPDIREQRYENPMDADTSVICFYALMLNDFEIKTRQDDTIGLFARIDSRLLRELGNSIVIYQSDDFINAVEVIKRKYPKTSFGQVLYSDDSTSMMKTLSELENGKINARSRFFYKSTRYSYQKEWRLVFPYKFNSNQDKHIPFGVVGSIIPNLNPNNAIWIKIELTG